MKYNRNISESFSKLFQTDGELNWLIQFVKSREELDLLIGEDKLIFGVSASSHSKWHGSRTWVFGTMF